MCASWTCLQHRGLSCTWTCTCPDNMTLCSFWMYLHQRDMSCRWTYLDDRSLYCFRPVLLTKVPSHWALSFTWTCLHYRGLCCTWNYLWSIGAWAAHRLVCTKKLPNILSRLQQVQVKLQHAQTGSKMSACNMLEDAATYSAAPRLNRLQYVLLQNARTGGKMSGCNMLEQAAILCCTL